MTATDLAALVACWRRGERVPLWDALCEASEGGEPVEEWLAVPGKWCLFVGKIHVACAWSPVPGFRHAEYELDRTGDSYGFTDSLDAAKTVARAAAVASLRGEA